GGASRWWVLHTRPRAEKTLARKCLGRGTPFFLPVYQKEWRSRGRLLRSNLPLFPGYLFLRGTAEDRLHALETHLIVPTLPADDPDRAAGPRGGPAQAARRPRPRPPADSDRCGSDPRRPARARNARRDPARAAHRAGRQSDPSRQAPPRLRRGPPPSARRFGG